MWLTIGAAYVTFVFVPLVVLVPRYLAEREYKPEQSVFMDMLLVWRSILVGIARLLCASLKALTRKSRRHGANV